MKPVTFVVFGEKIIEPKITDADAVKHETGAGLTLEAVYKVGMPTRDKSGKLPEITLNEENIAEFEFNDGTVWIADTANIHDVFPEIDTVNRTADIYVLPTTIKNTDADRGLIGDIVLNIIRIFIKAPINNGIKTLAEQLEQKHLSKNGEKQEGLFCLNSNFTLSSFNEKSSLNPFLLFVHGTNSSTQDAFGALIKAEVWDFIQKNYGDNVLAFQHRTLTESPLKNAVDLATSLPDNAVLHIVSHSRGGLIGDILCKYAVSNGQTARGFSNISIELLKKEGRQNDIENIKQLDTILFQKNITIKKFVRVACPGAGTKLVSNRMENIFNVLYNLGGGSNNPFAIGFKAIISEILKSKNNVDVLLGLEAMDPDSPFIKILNDRSDDAAINDSSLAVISGNSQANLNLKGLATIVTRLFFWQRNDLVVNTDSMYLGANRSKNIQYFFDQGSLVAHTSYFFNNSTAQALFFALKTEDGLPIPGFTSVPQLEVPASDRGLEHGQLFSLPPSGKKPIVILLPGIMGSNLGKNGGQIWINYWQFIKGGLIGLQNLQDKDITAASIVRTSYEKLYKQLSFSYDVVIYPFDWRKQLNECATELNDKILELMKLNQPIKLVGHSMGGVLVRDFIVTFPQTWQKLNNSKDFRLLFLGSPLGGSYRIPAVLFGNDSIINSLATIDLRHTKKELLSMFCNFPGILSLLPLAKEEGKDFAKEETWQKMRDAFGDETWPLPNKEILENFGAYRDKIPTFFSDEDYKNMVYIAGKDKATPCDYTNNVDTARKELVFWYTGEGDQSVTWASGIPEKLIAKDAVYYVDVTHGALANEPSMFTGIEDILKNGSTNELSKIRPSTRGSEGQFRATGIHNFNLSESGIENAILGIGQPVKQQQSHVPITVSVSKGDLKYASYPLLAGHFKNDGILYAEKAIDRYLNYKLSAKNSIEVYPGDIGTSDIFIDKDSDYQGAIIVGLGEQGLLTSFLLSKTIEQGVANYLISSDNQANAKQEIGISALIIGSGYAGLSIENSLKAIIEGVNNANAKVSEMMKIDVRLIEHLEFIEAYDDRVFNCEYVLNKIQHFENKHFNIKIGKTKSFLGSKKRLPIDAEANWWNRISVKLKETIEIPKNGDKPFVIHSLAFGASTGDAREEESELFSSTSLIDLFIEEMSTHNNWDGCAAKTIFELMIPNNLKDKLKRKGNIVWIMNKGAAAYPWELLQDSAVNAKPLCINAGMVRQLATTTYRANIRRVTQRKALIIGDPLLSGFINQLDGAKKEAIAVETVMKNIGYVNTAIIGKTSSEVVQGLFSDDYKIIHLAGHGVFDPAMPYQSGMVIGKNMFLTTADIGQMSTVPELVFVNCCHLGKVSDVDEQFYSSRYQLAANIGTELIQIGVKAVIAAGWKVDDTAAMEFAEIFYREMFNGSNFGDAVKSARGVIYDNHHTVNNTWGAYQCYGDPLYKLEVNAVGRKKKLLEYLSGEQAEVDLGNLGSDIETGIANEKEALERLQDISVAIAKPGIKNSANAEMEATIYAELGDYKTAIQKFSDLFQNEKAQFSVSALEKYYNVKAKRCVEVYLHKKDGKLTATELKKERAERMREIDKIIEDFKPLLLISPTAERYGLIGGAYKRKAIIAKGNERKKALKAAAFYYYIAAQKSSKAYPITSWYMIEAIIKMNENNGLWVNEQAITVDHNLFITKQEIENGNLYTLVSLAQALENLNALKSKSADSVETMDHWSLLSLVNLDFCEMVINTASTGDWHDLQERYKRMWKKSGSPAKRKTELELMQTLHEILGKDSNLKSNLKKIWDDLGKV